jgi:hypothetical protein
MMVLRALRQASKDEKQWLLEWKHHYLNRHPSTAVTTFSAYSIGAPPIYSLPTMIRPVYNGIENFLTNFVG